MKADELLCNRVLHKLGKTLNKSVNLGSAGSFKVTASITGFGVARSLYHYCRLTEQTLEGKRVLIEGFGNVAGLAACYIDRAGAKVVGVITRRDEGFQIARSGCGLDITDLICRRNNQRYLPAEYPYCDCSDEFWQTEADVFLTATSSRSITAERLAQLKTLGVQVIIGAANFPFAESSPGETCVQESADRMFSVIPDFIANCGKARAFSYLMDEPEDLTPSAIFKDVDWTIRQTMEAVLGCTDGERTGLLNSAYTLYVEKPVYTM